MADDRRPGLSRDDDELAEEIRRIAGQPGAQPATAAAIAGDDEPILDLTETVPPGGGAGNGNGIGAGSRLDDDDEPPLQLVDRVDGGSASLADASPSAVLAKLAERDADLKTARADMASVSTRSLDAVVSEALRPILTQWLDANLERIVREQVDAALHAERESRGEL